MNMLRRLFVVAALVACVAACGNRERANEIEAETAARESFGRAIVIDAGAGRALGAASRSDVLFEDGFANLQYDPPDDYRNHAFRWMGQRGHVRLKSHGERPMKLKISGWLHEKVIRARPVVTLYVDGGRLYDTGAVPDDGLWGAEVTVGPGAMRGAQWIDLVITVSAVAFHWSDPPALNVVVVNRLEWSELP